MAEGLEGRVLLAGNVTAVQASPALLLTGDGADNEIQIKSGNTPTEIIVNGLNQTLVNGSSQEQHFFGVEQIGVALNGGNDVVDVRNLEFSSESLALLDVDGGTGDDRITVFNLSINATAPDDSSGSNVEVRLFGDITTSGTSTGNDVIDVSNTTIIAEDGVVSSAAFRIVGDFNEGGTITGGNDQISLSNTDIIASNAQVDAAAVLQILGDLNAANIGQGNDTISLTNTTVSAEGSLFSANTVMVDIQGDLNVSSGATVGGGNDNITIRNFVASASGGSGNTVDMNIFGDGDLVGQGLDVTSTIGGGNDVISLVNDDVVAEGANAATVLLYSDDRTEEGEAGTTVGQGEDDVLISNFLLEASTSANMQLQTQKGRDIIDIHNSQFGGLAIDTGGGNDELDILNSDWMLGNLQLREGNDVLRLNANFLGNTTADGGLGIDTLQKNNNTGVLVHVNFENFQ